MDKEKIKKLLGGEEVKDGPHTYLYLPKQKTVLQTCEVGCCNEDIYIDDFLEIHR